MFVAKFQALIEPIRLFVDDLEDK